MSHAPCVGTACTVHIPAPRLAKLRRRRGSTKTTTTTTSERSNSEFFFSCFCQGARRRRGASGVGNDLSACARRRLWARLPVLVHSAGSRASSAIIGGAGSVGGAVGTRHTSNGSGGSDSSHCDTITSTPVMTAGAPTQLRATPAASTMPATAFEFVLTSTASEMPCPDGAPFSGGKHSTKEHRRLSAIIMAVVVAVLTMVGSVVSGLFSATTKKKTKKTNTDSAVEAPVSGG